METPLQFWKLSTPPEQEPGSWVWPAVMLESVRPLQFSKLRTLA